MGWRESMFSFCGPGVLSGISLRDWLHLLLDERAQIDFSRLPRVASITLQSLKNSAFGVVERRRYDSLIREVVIQPPLFILGHWRNGTTHLHQLIAQDDRFGFPNTYQTAFPRTFLSTEAIDSRLTSFFVPKHRPMDKVDISLTSPQEDEFALCASCLRSPCMAWVFPRQREKFGRYLTFRDVEARELSEWKDAFLHFVKKLQCRSNRPLVLKSPQHTARIRLLLELFPAARFVHIHRNPFRVFQSTRRLLPIMFRWHGLQRPNLGVVDDWVLNQYREMYEAFFDQKNLIPAGRFHEVSFEVLERDPIGEVRKIYQALALPDFSVAEPNLHRYIQSQAGYQQNTFTELSPELKKRIAQKWSECFEQWGYPMS
jgi:hypothetical protein